MNAKKVHFVLDLAIHEGKFDDFAATLKLMTEGTACEPGALAYEWYVSDDRKQCRLFETYANADAMKAHMASHVVQELLPKLLTSSTIQRFEVYGAPDAQSAAALKSAGAVIFPHWHGLPARQATSASGFAH